MYGKERRKWWAVGPHSRLAVLGKLGVRWSMDMRTTSEPGSIGILMSSMIAVDPQQHAWSTLWRMIPQARRERFWKIDVDAHVDDELSWDVGLKLQIPGPSTTRPTRPRAARSRSMARRSRCRGGGGARRAATRRRWCRRTGACRGCSRSPRNGEIRSCSSCRSTDSRVLSTPPGVGWSNGSNATWAAPRAEI